MRHDGESRQKGLDTQLGCPWTTLMAIDTIAGRLMDLDAFRGLAPGQVERIAREADRIIFRDGQTIAEAGQACDGALVIISGHANLLAHGEPALLVEAGSMIGETGMLTEHHYGSTILARGEVRAIKIMRETLLELMRGDPPLREHFVGRVASRLSRMAVELRLIDERLATVGEEPRAVAAASRAHANG